MGLVLRYIAASFLAACGLHAQIAQSVPILYTETPRYDSAAASSGGERFPGGAAIQFLAAGRKHPLVPAFAVTADPAVSFDGRRILFAAKPKATDQWQIWEMPLNGGAPRSIVSGESDAIAPFYLPADRIVYSIRTPSGFQIATLPLEGGTPLQLTYGAGNRVPADVLLDGRILFESANELYTAYSDGSGVESYRCEHGPIRRGARQVSSGDIVFETAGHLARYTSARAVQLPLTLPKGEYLGPVAELSPEAWIVSYRPDPAGPHGLYLWRLNQTPPEKILTSALEAVQPVLARPRTVPKRHPSALGDREGANLLCLNVYASKLSIPPGAVAKVRVWALPNGASPLLLGEAPVETDGSFFVNPPSETAIRFELLDRSGKIVAAEKNWFWARRGEQRVCVGCHAGPERSPENAVPEVLLKTTDPVMLTIHRGPK
jgi:hypothetical protein